MESKPNSQEQNLEKKASMNSITNSLEQTQIQCKFIYY